MTRTDSYNSRWTILRKRSKKAPDRCLHKRGPRSTWWFREGSLEEVASKPGFIKTGKQWAWKTEKQRTNSLRHLRKWLTGYPFTELVKTLKALKSPVQTLTPLNTVIPKLMDHGTLFPISLLLTSQRTCALPNSGKCYSGPNSLFPQTGKWSSTKRSPP